MMKLKPYAPLLGAGLALSLGAVAMAQGAAVPTPIPGSAASAYSQAPPTAAPPAAAVAPNGSVPPAATDSSTANPKPTADIKSGDVVKGADGAVVGTVVRTATASNGAQAVVVDVDGKKVSLPANAVEATPDGVVTSATKAQILALAR